MRSIVIVLVSALCLSTFSGCSWFSKSTKADIEPAPRVVQSVPMVKNAPKEPGSLWSEDSRWNTIYAVGPTRQPGDVVTIKINEPFKQRIVSAINLGRKPDEPKAVADSGSEKADPKAEPKNDKKEEGRDIASVGAGGKEGKDDTKTVEATILEVMPNGFYRVGMNRAYKIGKEEPYVTIEASLREKEIAADETVSSDSLLNLKVEPFDEKKNKVAQNEQGAANSAAKASAADPNANVKKEAKK